MTTEIENLINNINNININVDTTENLVPTPYRVSTITCNGSLGSSIDLNILYKNVKLSDACDVGNFVWVEFGTQNSRGINRLKRRPNLTDRKSFDNQVTMIYKIREGYAPNIKVFRNGNIQMTGIRSPDDGKNMVELISNEVKRIAVDVDPLITRMDEIKPCDFKIRMINSDFSFDFRIRRKDLHMLLISNKYNTISSFQPGTYPGVKIQYFWNEKSTTKNGHCECRNQCHGRGENVAIPLIEPLQPLDKQCKKVTVSVFESGKILITGATSYEQIDEAYAYIVKVIQENINHIKKVNIPCF